MRKKISASIKEQIREAYKDGMGITELSRRFGLSVYKINTVLEDIKVKNKKIDMKAFNKWMKSNADHIERSEAIEKIKTMFSIERRTAENYYMGWRREYLKSQNVKINMHVTEKNGVITAKGNNGQYLIKNNQLVLYKNEAYLNLGSIKHWNEFKQEIEKIYNYLESQQEGFKLWG
ncbi:hypothetical protein BJV85_002060 [Clostridium acetobutylicum]|uniref:Uncharacterized protein n=1 Tax=Clostridium acetobutylicum (strain ATCC 824 / DSM 792 / JCM 1419 / IAM 19013 / LMG 5710 / NBRC 13948 / NRRL B-527 / VKM B-1787 / 2291 / W) TaxID=272562 RepID=Q97HS6_CLOAB|nr:MULTISPECIES: hypothetical protein [Clostridium]AAK79894.1 Hypothetical protein CA_C1932 [Clostridium acetobutylicum ATCC 824]ADZ20984.1 Conserved hypothetical protein [Clostridium acetobutylicum EA 2018]AEI32071.1 hypothetical protein SMB_G1961 [Clostridium acetobutylicum DSM 1731]AWV79674.1 hypothetical protein DK921_06085 [Clostridium acetobutylicum]MBC2394350.1 hypothetical protein [Clostridium acetobutylicum]